jgi:probable H4MPT-linked C1 transfer pathway protein
VADFADCEEIAVTMTGELCDCFDTKWAGVICILNAVLNVARCRPVWVWGTDGEFRHTEDAKRDHMTVAAANWHATATFVGGYVPRGTALLVDIGSTTTDLIPILDGVPWTVGKTDTARLRSGELVYTGVKRTPAAVFLGPDVASEFFAAAHDAYLLLGDVPDDMADCDTADGRPSTQTHAHARLSRMICGDPVLTSAQETRTLATRFVERQKAFLVKKVEQLLPRLQEMRLAALHPYRFAVVAGSGEFLARRLVDQLSKHFDEVLSLSDRLGPDLSACAPAYAVARLLAERRP